MVGIPSWLLPVGCAAIVAAGLYWVYDKGYQSAAAQCRQAELEATLKAKDQTIERYKAMLAATELQRATEAANGRERERLIQDRMVELAAEKALAEASEKEIETDLASAISDKGKLDAIVHKLRASARTDCRAAPADVRLDQRLRGPQP